MTERHLRRACALLLLAGALSFACASGDDGSDGANDAGTTTGGDLASGASSSESGASSQGGNGAMGGVGSLAGEQGEGGGATTTEPQFPCDVAAVIQTKCQRCHTEPQQNGAPFPLLIWEDTRREYGLQLVYQAMLPAIEKDFMPFTELELDPPVEPLTPDEKALMLAWLRADAPAAFVRCD